MASDDTPQLYEVAPCLHPACHCCQAWLTIHPLKGDDDGENRDGETSF